MEVAEALGLPKSDYGLVEALGVNVLSVREENGNTLIVVKK